MAKEIYIVTEKILIYQKHPDRVFGIRVAGVFNNIEKAKSFILSRHYPLDYQINKHTINYIEKEKLW